MYGTILPLRYIYLIGTLPAAVGMRKLKSPMHRVPMIVSMLGSIALAGALVTSSHPDTTGNTTLYLNQNNVKGQVGGSNVLLLGQPATLADCSALCAACYKGYKGPHKAT